MTVVRGWEKAGLDGPSVTTSGIGAAASASAAASVVFASFPAELQIQVQSVCRWKSGSTKGQKDKAAKDGCKHGLLRNKILLKGTNSILDPLIAFFKETVLALRLGQQDHFRMNVATDQTIILRRKIMPFEEIWSFYKEFEQFMEFY